MLNYNIHDSLTFQINRPKCRDFVKDINLPYSYFETEHIEKPDIVLNIGPFKPRNEDCCIVDHKWYIRNDYIYCSEHIGRIKVDVEIIGLETNPTVINANTNIRQIKQLFFPSVLPQYIVLRPTIDFKLLCKGFLSIHAAAAANEKGAIVFLGSGGAFKTTLLMDYVRKLNYKFLGDDRIIVNKNYIFSFPIHSKLFNYRVNNMETEDYSLLDKYKYIFYQKSNRRKFDYINDKALISSFYFIVKSDNREIKTQKRSKAQAQAKILYTHKMETIGGPGIMGISKGLYDYFTAYSYVFPDSKIARYWDTYESTLDDYLKDDTYYEISLPRTYTKTTFQAFTSLVKDLEKQRCKRAVTPSTI